MWALVFLITRARKNNCGRSEISARALRKQKTQAKAGMYFHFLRSCTYAKHPRIIHKFAYITICSRKIVINDFGTNIHTDFITKLHGIAYAPFHIINAYTVSLDNHIDYTYIQYGSSIMVKRYLRERRNDYFSVSLDGNMESLRH